MKLNILYLIYFTFHLSICYNETFGQVINYSSNRAISINEVIFEEKSNILGEFYITPVIEDHIRQNDSIIISGSVLSLNKPDAEVMVVICKKAQRTLCQKICKIRLYEVKRFGCTTDIKGNFKIKIHKKNEFLLFRDYYLKQDQFLFIYD